jgi:hypothetical protein
MVAVVVSTTHVCDIQLRLVPFIYQFNFRLLSAATFVYSLFHPDMTHSLRLIQPSNYSVKVMIHVNDAPSDHPIILFHMQLMPVVCLSATCELADK